MSRYFETPHIIIYTLYILDRRLCSVATLQKAFNFIIFLDGQVDFITDKWFW